MKYILITIPGAADHPCEEFGGKTPLDVSKIPNLHALAKRGKVGQVKLYPNHANLAPETTLMNLFGYDADKHYTGLAALEAANLDLVLENNEVPFRFNFITEADGILADPTAGKLTAKEGKALINFLNKKVASDFVRFFPGSEYRHIAVIKDAQGYDALSAKTSNPHDVVGSEIKENLPKGPGGELLKKLMYDARLLLQDHEINQVRVDLGENPANMIWLWGQGVTPKLEKFISKFGLTGAMMSDAEYAKGFARLIGLTVVDSASSQGELAEILENKGNQMLDELKEKDFVCVHLRECEEASRSGDVKAKVAALESLDYYVLSRVKRYFEDHDKVRVLITPCHVTEWKTKQRKRESVPFVVVGKNIVSNDSERFTELSAKASTFHYDKISDLMTFFLTKEAVGQA